MNLSGLTSVELDVFVIPSQVSSITGILNFTANTTNNHNTSPTFTSHDFSASGVTDAAEVVAPPSQEVSASLASTRFVVQTIITPIVVTIGLLGNFFNILVLVQPNMRTSTNVYLLTLAMADSVYLIFSFTLSFVGCRRQGLSYAALAFNTYGRTISDVAGNIAVWIIAIFTVERYVAVCHPMYGKRWCTVRRAKLLSLVAVVFCLANTMPGFFELEIAPGPEGPRCQYTAFASSPSYELGYTWWYVTIFTFVPCVFLLIFNSLLIHTLVRAARDRELLLAGGRGDGEARRRNHHHRDRDHHRRGRGARKGCCCCSSSPSSVSLRRMLSRCCSCRSGDDGGRRTGQRMAKSGIRYSSCSTRQTFLCCAVRKGRALRGGKRGGERRVKSSWTDTSCCFSRRHSNLFVYNETERVPSSCCTSPSYSEGTGCCGPCQATTTRGGDYFSCCRPRRGGHRKQRKFVVENGCVGARHHNSNNEYREIDLDTAACDCANDPVSANDPIDCKVHCLECPGQRANTAPSESCQGIHLLRVGPRRAGSKDRGYGCAGRGQDEGEIGGGGGAGGGARCPGGLGGCGGSSGAKKNQSHVNHAEFSGKLEDQELLNFGGTEAEVGEEGADDDNDVAVATACAACDGPGCHAASTSSFAHSPITRHSSLRPISSSPRHHCVTQRYNSGDGGSTSRHHVAGSDGASPAHSCAASSPSVSPRSHDTLRNSRKSREQNKVTLMLTVIVIIFLLCQLPWTVLYLYRAYLSAHNITVSGSDAMKIAGNVVNLLAQVNASGNFYLYSFFSKKFRRTLARLFLFWKSGLSSHVSTQL